MLAILLILFFCSIFGFLLAYFEFDAGRWIVYVTVPIGSIGVIIGAVLALLGKVEKDFLEYEAGIHKL